MPLNVGVPVLLINALIVGTGGGVKSRTAVSFPVSEALPALSVIDAVTDTVSPSFDNKETMFTTPTSKTQVNLLQLVL